MIRAAAREPGFVLREAFAAAWKRTPFRRPPADHDWGDRAMPAHGATVSVDGISMRIDPRMSPFNIRKLALGRHTIHERALLARHLRDGDRVLELGGGIGMVAIACARRLGPGRVTSYEGNPELESLIRENYALNGVEVDLRMAVVGPRDGTVTFHLHDRFSHSRIGAGGGATRAVEVPVHDFARVRAEVAPTVLVIDIQGAEREFFRYADLDGVRMVLVELHPPLIGLRGMLEVRDRLRAAGFAQVDRGGTSFVHRRV